MRRKTLLALTTALLSSGLSFVAPPTTANTGAAAGLPVQCVQLPGKLLGGNIKYANAQIWGRSLATSPAGPRALRRSLSLTTTTATAKGAVSTPA